MDTILEIKDRIRDLSRKRGAIILAHNYQPPEIQDIADLCGDSLELSIKASQTDADVILFCGVHFMAETASILSPEKRVILPRRDAGCLMADMISREGLEVKMAEFPDIPVVTYVNSTADVKAISTICCTSANVIDVVNSIDSEEIIMTPDRNLARYAASKTEKRIHIWDGYCPTHDRLRAEDIIKIRLRHPDAIFIAHPECRPEVLEKADVISSTSGMIRYVKESRKNSFIIGTEIGLIYPLKKENPDKRFYAASEKMLCKNMKKITLKDVKDSLEFMKGEVKVPEYIRIPAFKAVKMMIDIAT